MPYMRHQAFPYADTLIEWIVEKANSNLKIGDMNGFAGLGKRSRDE